MLDNANGRLSTRRPPERVIGRTAAASDADLSVDKFHLSNMVRRAPGNAALRMKLAMVLRATGDRAGAAMEAARALRHAPDDTSIANFLCSCLSPGKLPDSATLDARGLAAALAMDLVDRELIGAACLHQLMTRGPLAAAIGRCGKHGVEATARQLVQKRSVELFRDELLLAVLSHAVIAPAPVEHLLTALRRSILLDVARERLHEPELGRFAVALGQQMRLNEYLYPRTADEDAALVALNDRLAGVCEDERQALEPEFIKLSLYSDPADLLGSEAASNRTFRSNNAHFSIAIERNLSELREIQDSIGSIPSAGRIQNATSERVRNQYEAYPYPQWTSVSPFPGGQFLDYLETFVGRSALAFTQRPFDVLIAGCGTGRQAVSAAFDYGPKANVLGLDLSRSSLGYAAMMARRLGAQNVTFMHGDIGELAALEPPWKERFQVIECSGVLHHMAQPFEAWRQLLACLAPKGIMLVGLYSRLARRDVATLRSLPDYPGPDCSDDALRAWRKRLLDRPAGAPGEKLLRMRDALTTNGFRDFFLHVHEQPTTIEEIDRFLRENGLAFAGFVNVSQSLLKQHFPEAKGPGTLEQWAQVEAANPDLFISMYQFWVTRA